MAVPTVVRIEPIYLAQTAEPMSDDGRRQWIRERVDEGWAKGAAFFRASIHAEILTLTLVEGWEKQPADQGEIRWQLTEASRNSA